MTQEHSSLQDIGAAAQLERDEIQGAVSTCNNFAEAERRSMHDLLLDRIYCGNSKPEIFRSEDYPGGNGMLIYRSVRCLIMANKEWCVF